MTLTDLPRPDERQPGTDPGNLESTPPQQHPYRWRMNRAGIVNVWYYYDTEFDLSGGRLVLRGTNGSGKSRALELLLPFLLDADRRKMDATGSGKVRLQDLMRAGGEAQPNRLGYLWLELARDTDPDDSTHTGARVAYLTIGALVRFSHSTGDATPYYFTTPLRVGDQLPLLSATREPLSRDRLTELVGVDRITESPPTHRDRVRASVFGLTGDAGKERYEGLLQLLHTLRSPDVGNRIEEGKLPQILSDALPPLSEDALNAAGEQLDGLSETRDAQARLEQARSHITTFLGSYRRYTATVLTDTADSARGAADIVHRAQRDAREKEAEHERLVREYNDVAGHVTRLEESVEGLEGTVSGIRASKAYTDARDLDERARKVDALGAAADSSLGAADAARRSESRAVDDADEVADDVLTQVRTAARALADARSRLEGAGISGGLPETVTAELTDQVEVTEEIRTHRDAPPILVSRPQPKGLTVRPDDVPGAAAHAERVKSRAADRSRQADSRLRDARAVTAAQQQAEAAQRRAADAAEESDDAETEADDRAAAADDVALDLAEDWRAWTTDPDTVTAYGPDVLWADTVAGPALATPDTLTDPDAVDLAALDRVAAQLAGPVRDAHTHTLAGLDRDDSDAARDRDLLEAEARGLRAAVDPAPPAPPWLTVTAEPTSDTTSVGVPLWRCVDFVETVPEHERTGVEGALLASGLLLATVTTDGRVLAADGELLATATGDLAANPLSQVLVPDTASGISAGVVTGLLDRVGYGPGSHDTWVSGDGSWGNGPLTGRHQPAVARHIGAAARAAARAVRLERIAADLADLETARLGRDWERERARAALRLLKQQTESAPTSQQVVTARVRASDARQRAGKLRDRAQTMEQTAVELTGQWRTARDAHAAKCAEFALPVEADALATIQRVAHEAAGLCGNLTDALTGLGRRRDRHTGTVARAQEETSRREQAERDAAEARSRWHREATELESVRRTVGKDAEESLRALATVEQQLDKARAELRESRGRESHLAAESGAARVEAKGARTAVTAAHEALTGAVDLLLRRYALPGVVAAATGTEPEPLTLEEVTVASVRALVERVTATLPRLPATDENALMRAQQPLERDVSGTFDVTTEVHDGVRLVDLSDAAGRRSVAAAAAELERKVTEGRDALSDRERRVFTDFVLGGVAEELRRRLDQASALVEAMNASLATIKTSHGIGVKLRWRLDDAHDPGVGRIKDLVATAGAVRSPEQTRELTDLLKARVDEAFTIDASAGYAAHLQAALDYRAWHVVEVIILGPASGQERRISRKARLSQGETRFVSYVALFAAFDAYLSGLPDTDRALRLMLLDDAFAKVDERTIGELMGLLVRLDVDFAMTGHSLWGTYAQVPTLDCYEVRRVEGSAAVTTHVHWDGHTRHLRAAR